MAQQRACVVFANLGKNSHGGSAIGVEHEKAPRVVGGGGAGLGAAGSELQGFPGAAAIGAVLGRVPAGPGGRYLVGRHVAHLGLDGDAFGLTADAQLVDLAPTVFVLDALDALVVAVM